MWEAFVAWWDLYGSWVHTTGMVVMFGYLAVNLGRDFSKHCKKQDKKAEEAKAKGEPVEEDNGGAAIILLIMVALGTMLWEFTLSFVLWNWWYETYRKEKDDDDVQQTPKVSSKKKAKS